MTVKTKTELSQVKSEKASIDQSLKEHQSQVEILNKENADLKVKLQAKKEAEAKAAATAEEARKLKLSVPVKTSLPTVAVTGNKATWLAASGIPESQWTYVDAIVSRESGWNPNAVNKSSGACGLGQQLPCGKWAGAWNDPVAALTAMNGYVNKYGGWAGAYSFWQTHHWY